MSTRGVTLAVTDAVFVRLVELGRKRGLTPNAMAQHLFEEAYAADCGRPSPDYVQKALVAVRNQHTPERSGTAREAPSTLVEQAPAPVGAQPAAHPEGAGSDAAASEPAPHFVAPAPIVIPAADTAPIAGAEPVMSARQVKAARACRAIGNSFAEIAELTGFPIDAIRQACRGMR